MQLPIIRAHALTLASNCPASIAGDGLNIDSVDPTAARGVDIHRAIALGVEGKELPDLSAEDEEIVALGVEWVKNWLWVKYPKMSWLFNAALDHAPLSGSLDLLGMAPPEAVVVDFKATFRDDDHTPQLMGYSWLVCCEHPAVERVTSIVPLLRLGKAEAPVTHTKDWILGWMHDFTRNNINSPGTYRPGEWCRKCKRKHDCPALRRMLLDTAMVFSSQEFEGHLTRGNLPALWMRWKLIKEAGALLEEYRRTTVLEEGPIDIGNGKMFKAQEYEVDRIKLRAAWSLLQEQFPDDADIEAFVDIGKTKMLGIIGNRAARGMKGKEQNAFMDKLLRAGAVEKIQQIKVAEVKVEG